MAFEAVDRLREDAHALLDAGRTVVREYGGAGDSFRRLVLSDIALARVALIRGLVFLMLCTLLAGTAYAGITIMLVLGMQLLGVPLVLAILVPVVFSGAAAWWAWHTARKALAFTDMDSTRRQLSTWFPPTQPVSTESPTGQINPGPPDPEGPTSETAPEAP
ncbi:MAG: hypothetical protein ACREO3_10420 [Arenimonas sp.]